MRNFKKDNYIQKSPYKPVETKFLVREETELLAFLLKSINKSRNEIKVLLRDKHIFIEGRAVTQFNHILNPGQIIEVKWKKVPEEQKQKGLSIVFEDQHLIVIDKQEGVLSIATEKQKDNNAYSTLSTYVKKHNPANRIFVVHRLDRETSGLMIFAKSEKVQKLLQESWNETIEERTYLAVTEGLVEKDEGTITSYLVENRALVVYSSQNSTFGQKAITHYEVLRRSNKYSLVKFNLETGRKNQIRVHAKDMNHPIVGDIKYGAITNSINRLGLHAWILSFKHPVTKEELRFQTEMPAKFMKLFN
jgi:23S rRNA pseudouridine1911/1915/1917 synthase